MGIVLQVYKDGKEIIHLSDHSIQNIEFQTISDDMGEYHYPVILRGITIKGFIKGDSLEESYITEDNVEQPKEIIREIDSVRKLINWATLPEDTEYSMNALVIISDASGKIVKKDVFMNIFPFHYTEIFRDDMGAGQFHICLKEMLRKEKIKYNSEGISKAING